MKDKLTNKIREFFNEKGYTINTILKNSNKNADYQYYVIYNGAKDLMLDEYEYLKLINFQDKNKIDLLVFYEKDCISIKKLIKEFKTEGCQIIYSKTYKNPPSISDENS